MENQGELNPFFREDIVFFSVFQNNPKSQGARIKIRVMCFPHPTKKPSSNLERFSLK